MICADFDLGNGIFSYALTVQLQFGFAVCDKIKRQDPDSSLHRNKKF